MIVLGFLVVSVFSFGGAPGGFLAFVLVLATFALLYTMGLSALGGYVGAYLANEY
jgi:hypothetical protein